MYHLDTITGEITVGNKKFKTEFHDKKLIGWNPKLAELKNVLFTVADYPKELMISIFDDAGFGTHLFIELDIRKSGKNVQFKFAAVHDNIIYWQQKWGLSTFFGAMNDVISNSPDVKVSNLKLDKEWNGIEVDFTITQDFYFQEQLSKLLERLSYFIKQTEILLNGIIWRKEFETNEKLFCTDLLFPLLRKMNFTDVRYTHGKREYGKDFTFSEVSKFGNMRHFGLQAKAGSIRGSINSDIDEIIGQLNDAFSMPFHEISANESRHISIFIIAISGYFTENAKEKIVHKIPSHFKGSIYFMDKDKLVELLEKFWH